MPMKKAATFSTILQSSEEAPKIREQLLTLFEDTIESTDLHILDVEKGFRKSTYKHAYVTRFEDYFTSPEKIKTYDDKTKDSYKIIEKFYREFDQEENKTAHIKKFQNRYQDSYNLEAEIPIGEFFAALKKGDENTLAELKKKCLLHVENLIINEVQIIKAHHRIIKNYFALEENANGDFFDFYHKNQNIIEKFKNPTSVIDPENKEQFDIIHKFYSCIRDKNFTELTDFQQKHLENIKNYGDPVLLKKWAQFCWIKSIISNCANRKADTNTHKNHTEERSKWELKQDREIIDRNIHKKNKELLSYAEKYIRADDFKKQENTKISLVTLLAKLGVDSPEFGDKETKKNYFYEKLCPLFMKFFVKESPCSNEIAIYIIQQLTSFNRDKNTNLEVSAFPDSVGEAIQQDVAKGVTIRESIAKLQEIYLQIVGTEHPTDPYSAEAHDLKCELKNEVYSLQPNEKKIAEIFLKLMQVDTIPPVKRDAETEVYRNIKILLEPLYDTLPEFIRLILSAYKRYYGEELYRLYEPQILEALHFGHASWPGFDADGNNNVHAETMLITIALARKEISKKHRNALDEICKSCKDIERPMRDEIQDLINHAIKKIVSELGNPSNLFEYIDLSGKISKNLIRREFSKLEANLRDLQNYISENISFSVEKNGILSEVSNAINKAKVLILLTNFSGSHRSNGHSSEGEIQTFQKELDDYVEQLNNDSDAIEVTTDQNKKMNPTEYFLQKYNKLVQNHKELLEKYPHLKEAVQIFGIQLKSFGMTYGEGHIRQNAPVHEQVWETLLEDLDKDSKFSEHKIFNDLHDGKKYRQLSDEKRTSIMKALLNNSEQSQSLLQAIYDKYHKQIYLSYLNKPNCSEENKATIEIVLRELKRYELAVRHNDYVTKFIISNTESSANIFEARVLQALFEQQSQPSRSAKIVPLLEKRRDLENYKKILTQYMLHNIAQELKKQFLHTQKAEYKKLFIALEIESLKSIDDLFEHLKIDGMKKLINENSSLRAILSTTITEIMVGFSDTERVSGLPALFSIQHLLESFKKLCDELGVKPKIYYGPGGDPNRGGLKFRAELATLQGIARDVFFNVPQQALYYLETIFCAAYLAKQNQFDEFKNLPKNMQNLIVERIKGAEKYEHLHDTEKGLGKLMGAYMARLPYWLVKLLNSSSRATTRGIKEGSGDRTAAVQAGGEWPPNYIDPNSPRAITSFQTKAFLKDNTHLLIGSGYALRQLGLEKAIQLYQNSPTFRDFYDKIQLGLHQANYPHAWHGLFAGHPEYSPKNATERKLWAKECLETYPEKLKTMDIKSMLESRDPDNAKTILTMLSRLFAYFEEEMLQTQNFVLEMNDQLNFSQYKKVGSQSQEKPNGEFHYRPTLQSQMDNAKEDIAPIDTIFSRINASVADGKPLDQVYSSLNEQGVQADSKLSPVAGLLGTLGAALLEEQLLKPAYTETHTNNLKQNLGLGEKRARQYVTEAPSSLSNLAEFRKSDLLMWSKKLIDGQKEPETTKNQFDAKL